MDFKLSRVALYSFIYLVRGTKKPKPFSLLRWSIGMRSSLLSLKMPDIHRAPTVWQALSILFNQRNDLLFSIQNEKSEITQNGKS